MDMVYSIPQFCHRLTSRVGQVFAVPPPRAQKQMCSAETRAANISYFSANVRSDSTRFQPQGFVPIHIPGGGRFADCD